MSTAHYRDHTTAKRTCGWKFAAALSLVLASGGSGRSAYADSRTIGFENPPYLTGSIDGKDGWSGGGLTSTDPIATSIDQVVTGSDSRSGSQSWRISNNAPAPNGAFGTWPFGPSLVSDAGQPSSGAPRSRFFGTFWFKSGSTAADGSNIEVDLGTTAGDDRNSFLAITNKADADGGLQLRIAEPVENNLGGCDNFYPTLTPATNLDRTVWHRVDLQAQFPDGDYNDTIEYFLDGVPVTNTRTGGTTWFTFESYRNQCGLSYARTSRIYFRSGAAPSGYGSFSDAGAAGIYFDDVFYTSCGPRYVSTTGTDVGSNQCDVAGNPCLTIQHAVDVACTGDTVNVAAGTYTGQVTVGKSLTVIGAGTSSTTIQAPATLAPDASGAKNIVTISGASANVELSALTVAGPGPGTCGSITTGIFVRDGAHANIHDAAVADIADAPLSGCQNGVGILVGRASFVTSGIATITNTVVSGYQKGGIVISNSGSNATVSGNTITGVGATTMIAQNGVQVSGGATATVSGNTISGNECDHSTCGPDYVNDYQSAGILLISPATGTVISANDISNNDIGIYNSADGSTIESNALTGNRYEGIFLDQGDATVRFNGVQGGNIAVIAVSFTGNSENSAGTLTCNRISDATTGIDLYDQDTNDQVVPTITASSNVISSNGVGLDGTAVSAGPSLNAQNNYWGCSAGPGTAGCDTVQGNVSFTPFASTAPACVYCSVDSDCDDGLACNGQETCNLSTNTCQAGSAVNCAHDACHAATCTEPTGACQVQTLPDGTTCAPGDTCQDGRCTSESSLSLAAVRLHYDTSTLSDNGSLFVRAVVNDGDTGGQLAADLVAGGVTVEVQDSGSFHTVINLTNCQARGTHGAVACIDREGHTIARFVRLSRNVVTYGLLYRMTVSRSRLGTADTGSGPLSGPVEVVLHQVSMDRPADIEACQATGSSRLVCRN